MYSSDLYNSFLYRGDAGSLQYKSLSVVQLSGVRGVVYDRTATAVSAGSERQIAATQEDCAYADVYDLGEDVLKIIDTPYVMSDTPADNAETLQDRGIPHAETVPVDIDEYEDDCRSYATAVRQEKADATAADLVASGDEQYLTAVVDLLDTGIANGVVIRDAKLDNFGVFADGVKLIDVSDDESFTAYHADPVNGRRDQFMDDCAAMYRNLVRSAADHLDRSETELVDRVADDSRYLDRAAVAATTPLTDGLEQGLAVDYEEVTATLPPGPDDPHPFEEAAELGLL